MDRPGEHYAKWYNPVKERQIPWFHLYVESNEQKKLTNKRETDSYIENRLTAVRGEKGCGAGWKRLRD